jgi:hypothetical protein
MGTARERCVFSLLILAVWASPSIAVAQPAVNPTKATFNASPDHTAVQGGTAVVQSYELGLYLVGATQPFQRVSLGKPAPDANGVIEVDLRTIFTGWPVPGTNYVSDVAAIGPGGTARSAFSNTFSFVTTSCSFSASPTLQSPPASGGAYSSTVTTTAGCAWTATSNASWITITSGTSGTGAGTVSYSIAANPSTGSRTGTLTAAGQTITINQSGACSFTVAPMSQNPAASGGPLTASVTTSSGCSWTATSNATGWITVNSGSSGTGNGTVGYTVAANTSTGARTGTLTVAGKTVTIDQSGTCSFTVSPMSQSPAAAGGSFTSTVTTATGCVWGTASNAAWITVSSGTSGSGNGSVVYAVAANTSTASRTGTLMIAGKTVTVTQAGVGCNFTVTPVSFTVAKSGGSYSATVTTTSGCNWTSVSHVSWITIPAGASGTGNGTVTFAVASQTGSTSRSGTLTVAGRTITVTQSGQGGPNPPRNVRVTTGG